MIQSHALQLSRIKKTRPKSVGNRNRGRGRGRGRGQECGGPVTSAETSNERAFDVFKKSKATSENAIRSEKLNQSENGNSSDKVNHSENINSCHNFNGSENVNGSRIMNNSTTMKSSDLTPESGSASDTLLYSYL